jgi:hypothetical protein
MFSAGRRSFHSEGLGSLPVIGALAHLCLPVRRVGVVLPFRLAKKKKRQAKGKSKKRKGIFFFFFFHSRWPRDGPISGVAAAAYSVVVVKNKPKGEPFLCCLFSRPAAVAHVTIDATVDDDNAQAKRRRQQQQPSQTFPKQTCRRRSFIHSLSVCPFVFRFVSPASSGIFFL